MSSSTIVQSDRLMRIVNGVITSTQTIIPIEQSIEEPELLGVVTLEFGVLIGFTGDIKGRLIFKGQPTIFSAIGEKMFGMPIGEEMLISFAGELGNMISGNLATVISEQGITTDITSPTILQGNSKLAGFTKAINVNVLLSEIGVFQIVLLLDL